MIDSKKNITDRRRFTILRVLVAAGLAIILLLAWKSGLLNTNDPLASAAFLVVVMIMFRGIPAMWVYRDAHKYYPELNPASQAFWVFRGGFSSMSRYLDTRDRVLSRKP
jgi:hypothetical protein